MPTEEERRELAHWFDERQKCYEGCEALHRREWPPEIVQLADEGYAGLTEDLKNATLAKLAPIIKQYQAEIAAQKAAAQAQAERRQAYADAQQAREEQLRQQRAALIMNYMRSMQPKPIQLPPPPPTYTTNCNSLGNSTTCTTR